MRPGVVFVALFAVLISIYVLLQDTLGSALTFVLQSAIVIMILGAAIWFRRVRKSWSLFSDRHDEEELPATPEETGEPTGEAGPPAATDDEAADREESTSETRRAS